MTHAFRLEQTAYREQLAAIAPILERAHRIAYDRSGVGDPIGELCRRDAVPILITGGNTVDLVYGCWHYPKTKLITNLLELARAGRLVVEPGCPGGDDLKRELQDFRVLPGLRGRIRLKAKAGSHDDTVLAASLGVVAARLSKVAVKGDTGF